MHSDSTAKPSSYFPQDLNWIFIQQPNDLEVFSNLCYSGSLSGKELSLLLTLTEKKQPVVALHIA